MKVVVAVLTYNRMDLFGHTIKTLKRTKVPYSRIVVDNGSVDGTVLATEKLGGRIILNETGNHMVGYGFRLAVEAALEENPDLIVFSGDDFEYHEGWLEKLTAFWNAAPAKVALCGMYLEPMYKWCPVLKVVEYGGQRALVRGTLPGASWSFRPWLWDEIRDLVHDDSHYYDKKASQRLAKQYLLCQLPLAEHTGVGRRMWTTAPEDPGIPVDRTKWGI